MSHIPGNPSQPSTAPFYNVGNVNVQNIVRQVTGGDYIINIDQWHQATQLLIWNGFPIYMTSFALHPYYHPEHLCYNDIQQLTQQLKTVQNQLTELTEQLEEAKAKIKELEKKKRKWLGR